MECFKKTTRINSISKFFRKSVLGKANNKCFNVCLPLHFYLSSYNIKTTIAYGLLDETHHYILKLDEYSNMYIDPTITQFLSHKGKTKLFLGSIKEFQSFQKLGTDNLLGIIRNELIRKITNSFHDEKSILNIHIDAIKLFNKRDRHLFMQREIRTIYEIYKKTVEIQKLIT